MSDPDRLGLFTPVLVLAFERARDAREGYAGQGWMTGTEIAKRAQVKRVDAVAALSEASYLFAELGPASRRVVGAPGNARVFGLASWPADVDTLAAQLAPEQECPACGHRYRRA